jgi:hypothetical protein
MNQIEEADRLGIMWTHSRHGGQKYGEQVIRQIRSLSDENQRRAFARANEVSELSLDEQIELFQSLGLDTRHIRGSERVPESVHPVSVHGSKNFRPATSPRGSGVGERPAHQVVDASESDRKAHHEKASTLVDRGSRLAGRAARKLEEVVEALRTAELHSFVNSDPEKNRDAAKRLVEQARIDTEALGCSCQSAADKLSLVHGRSDSIEGVDALNLEICGDLCRAAADARRLSESCHGMSTWSSGSDINPARLARDCFHGESRKEASQQESMRDLRRRLQKLVKRLSEHAAKMLA